MLTTCRFFIQVLLPLYSKAHQFHVGLGNNNRKRSFDRQTLLKQSSFPTVVWFWRATSAKSRPNSSRNRSSSIKIAVSRSFSERRRVRSIPGLARRGLARSVFEASEEYTSAAPRISMQWGGGNEPI